MPDEEADVSQRALYLARKQAITLYLAGAAEDVIKQTTSRGAKQAGRLVRERCLKTHSDGCPYGWQGIVPWSMVREIPLLTRILSGTAAVSHD